LRFYFYDRGLKFKLFCFKIVFKDIIDWNMNETLKFKLIKEIYKH